jgi:serine/threonine protein phosphatase PrpC
MIGDGQPEARWSVGSCSIMGASHAAIGIPNQDAVSFRVVDAGGTAAVLALSDGHGAPQHFRSGIGSHVAVEVATAVLAELIVEPTALAASSGARRRAAIEETLARWRAQVEAHAAAHPLAREALFDEGDPLVPYGATLIAAAVAPGAIFTMQLGDGDLLLGRTDGSFLRPLPDDEGMIGEQTYSLCQADAAERVRARLLTADDGVIDFVMLSTDGLAKSFRDQQKFAELAASWRERIATSGVAALTETLDPVLSDISANGSRDDVTVGFMALAPGSLSEAREARKASGPPTIIMTKSASTRRGFAKPLLAIMALAAAAVVGVYLLAAWPR